MFSVPFLFHFSSSFQILQFNTVTEMFNDFVFILEVFFIWIQPSSTFWKETFISEEWDLADVFSGVFFPPF